MRFRRKRRKSKTRYHSVQTQSGPSRLPRQWIFTDEKRLESAYDLPYVLPPNTGVVFRHYGSLDRSYWANSFARICKARGLVFLVARDWRLAQAVGADGIHLPEYMVARPGEWRRASPQWIVTAAAHSLEAVERARDAGVDGIFISPVFPTRSHTGQRALGIYGAVQLARAFPGPCMALGGMTEDRFKSLKSLGFHGWGAIGAWLRPISYY